MRLLLITQKVDREDAVLGFFHRWLEVFAEHAEHVTVICLEKGTYQLPKHVNVFSLGKESGATRFKYILRLYQYIWRERKKYDSVFVHMNPEYVVLSGWLWRLLGKNVALWYNHAKGGFQVRVAALFAQHIFYTSPHAYARVFKQAQQMPAGIDIEKFTIADSKFQIPNSKFQILLLGRISPVKYVEVIVRALAILDERGIDFVASIYGDPTKRDHEYYKKIRAQTQSLEKKGKIIFHKGVANHETPAIYSTHDVFLNATPKGSFDKTVLEAAACGTIPIVCNESFSDIFPKELFFKEGNSQDLAVTMELLFTFPQKQREEIGNELHKKIVQKHSLQKLVKQITAILKGA